MDEEIGCTRREAEAEERERERERERMVAKGSYQDAYVQ